MNRISLGLALPRSLVLHIRECAKAAGQSQTGFLLDLISNALSFQDDWTRQVECPGCGTIFNTVHGRKKYCGIKCKKRVEARNHWLKVQADPLKMEQHRKKSRDAMRKRRLS